VKLYSVTNWERDFETCETRKLASLRWWPKPNRHDGLSFKRLVARRDRCELYAAWTLIGDTASKTDMPHRGKLIRHGKPLTAEDLELMTGFPAVIFERAFDFFSAPNMGWLTVTETRQEIQPENAPCTTAGPGVATDATPMVELYSPAKSGRHPGRAGDSPVEGKEGKEEKVGEGNAPPVKESLTPKINGVEVYPLPKGEPLPSPLYAGTARQMAKACDQQIEIVRRMAKKHRKPVVRKTAEGTEYQDGWVIPREAESAIDAWEKRKELINQALAG
jgi:hypothetical protein